MNQSERRKNYRDNPPLNGPLDIDTYLWEHRISIKTFAVAVGISYQHMLNIVKKRTTPNLAIALRIAEITFGVVSLYSLLTEEMVERLCDLSAGHSVMLRKNANEPAGRSQAQETEGENAFQETEDSA